MDQTVTIANLHLKNPVITASGTFGYGLEMSSVIDLNKLGGIVVKGITLAERKGNPPPRIWETPMGMLNSIGLQNVGVERFIGEKLPGLRNYDTAVIVNISGQQTEDYAELSRILSEPEGVHALEVNISCPNVTKGGMLFGKCPKRTFEVVSAVRQNTRLPVIVKLTPNVSDIAEIAMAAQDAGADALSLINTLQGMAIDVDTRKPRLATITGGLSGPAIKPVALAMVWQVYKVARVPVVGMGGIMNLEDALEFLLAGASALQIGTANFIDPQIPLKIIQGLQIYGEKNGLNHINELIGKMKMEELERLL